MSENDRVSVCTAKPKKEKTNKMEKNYLYHK